MDGPEWAQEQRESDDLLASLATPQVAADPYPVYAALRARGPVRSAAGAVFVAGYDDCATVARDPAFRAQSPKWNDRAAPGWRDSPAMAATFETMLFRDPPEHTRLRRLVSGAFTPRQADRMREGVEGLVDAALDRVADAGSGGTAVNLHEILASSLPISIIATLVGVPPSDWPVLRPAMSQLLQLVELSVSKQERADADHAAMILRDYFAALSADRRAAPRDDLATALVAASDADPAAFTPDELLQTLTFLFMAGVDTMTNLLSNGTAALLTHPAQAERLRADPRLGAAAVDEALRYDAPVQLVGRVAATETRLGEVAVSAGQLVIAIIGAGNRDPERFPDPDRFDIGRTGSTVLSFGGGLHYCIGAPLARLQAGLFFPALLGRFPGLRLAGEPVRRGLVFRGFSELPVAWR